jgi:hypothetical protein
MIFLFGHNFLMYTECSALQLLLVIPHVIYFTDEIWGVEYGAILSGGCMENGVTGFRMQAAIEPLERADEGVRAGIIRRWHI